jgi:formylglycine-generating enzyme required for sulfatase activity
LAYPNGQKRLFDPNDVTRWEVETGLRRSREENATVIPVRVMGAGVPTAEDLPETLRPLLDMQLREIRNYPDLPSDMERLISDIRRSRGYSIDDSHPDYEVPRMVYIAEGKFLMGSPAGEGIPDYEARQFEVNLPAFWIGQYPVTNEQYEKFISQTRTPVTPQMGWDGQTVPEGRAKYPVIGIKFDEALAYCRYLDEKTGQKYSLPNEAQWEKACRGGNQSLYPWGDEFEEKRSNHGQSTIAPVDAFIAQNDYECFDFVGNVRQWTCSLWGEKRINPDPKFAYPWRDDSRNDLNASRQIRRVVRGSSMTDDLNRLRCSARSGQLPDDAGLPGARHGFRVMRNV